MERESRIVYSQKASGEIAESDQEDFLAFELFLKTGKHWSYLKDDQGRLNFFPTEQSPTPPKEAGKGAC